MLTARITWQDRLAASPWTCVAVTSYHQDCRLTANHQWLETSSSPATPRPAWHSHHVMSTPQGSCRAAGVNTSSLWTARPSLAVDHMSAGESPHDPCYSTMHSTCHQLWWHVPSTQRAADGYQATPAIHQQTPRNTSITQIVNNSWQKHVTSNKIRRLTTTFLTKQHPDHKNWLFQNNTSSVNSIKMQLLLLTYNIRCFLIHPQGLPF